MELSYFVPVAAFAALSFAIYLTKKVFKVDEGTKVMIEIAEAVREGASAYLARQYRISGIFFFIIFALLGVFTLIGFFPPFVPFAFLTGVFFSGLAGFCGMKIATNASARTANVCQNSLNQGLQIAFASGSVMGLVVVGLGLLDLSFWYHFLNWFYAQDTQLTETERLIIISQIMLTIGMGASFQALFSRVGGGIFTKAADVGADLVGKVEAGIPEDDARNPAVIADNVGDNVGDVAGMGADLYESFIGSIIATGALGIAAGLGARGMVIPMLIGAVGVIASLIGMTQVKTQENASQKSLLGALRKGIYVASFIMVLFIAFGLPQLLGAEYASVSWAVIIGLVAGNIIGFLTEYFTSAHYKPTQKIAESARTGPATVIISGMGMGMLSTAFPMIVVAIAILLSFWVSGGFTDFTIGLYGIGIAAVGMLSTLGITLATDAYGPVADNAGGNAQMAGLDPKVRQRTDALDSLGNTTAATGKGFAIGSAALTALALIAAYKDKIISEGFQLDLNLSDPLVLIGVFIGTMMPYLFSALTMQAVGKAAQFVVIEVRRQFKEIEGIMERKAKPDFHRCVDIVTKAALNEMIVPALLAILAPISVGILLGVNSVGGMLIGATASGFVLAIMMANSGGAWDNAKKYIEEGAMQGKGSEAHKASVVGDTVGDPFKDTSGPSINILIKLMSMVSIVFGGLLVKFSLFG